MQIVKIAYLKNCFRYYVGTFRECLKGEDHLTKKKYMHTTTNITVSAAFYIIISIDTTCKAKSTETKVQ